MKKIIQILILTALVLMTSACNNSNNDVIDGVENPVVSYNSLSEINQKAEINIVIPSEVIVENESFHMIGDEIAEYKFKVNGVDYSIRGSKNLSDDISGIYDDEGNPAFSGEIDEQQNYYSDELKATRVKINDCQYVITIEDENGLDEEMFLAVIDEYINSITNGEGTDELDLLVGNYTDSEYQNVSMSVVKGSEEGTLEIVVNYSESEGNIEIWSMVATKKNNKLIYDTGEHFTITTDENGTTTISEKEEMDKGEFIINQDTLTWNILINDEEIQSVLTKTN